MFYVLHPRLRWFNNPHKLPSGVCTGHINPHESGNNFLTDVVFISTKYAPLWIDLKWDQNLILFNLSAIIDNPLFYIKSKPVFDFKFPVDKRDSILVPILGRESMIFNIISYIYESSLPFLEKSF